MLLKRKIIIIKSRQVKNYNLVFIRKLFFGAEPVFLCFKCKYKKYHTCIVSRRRMCENLDEKFKGSWKYVG